jgi:putative ABC transport system substrate-binding protein
MRRRAFLSVLCGAVTWPLAAAEQQSINKKRLAIFSPSEPSADLHEHSESKFSRALFAELRRFGQIEGQNLKVESYGREQNTSGPEALATEIVRSNPDVIFVVGPGAPIFKKLTSRIPIVVITGDPVKQGIAESLAHPGGNFTGASIDAGLSIHGKRIALLREMVPTMSKLGMGRAQALSAQLPKWQASLSRCLYWNLVPAKQTFGQRSRASPATVQMRSWSSIRLRPFKRAP